MAQNKFAFSIPDLAAKETTVARRKLHIQESDLYEQLKVFPLVTSELLVEQLIGGIPSVETPCQLIGVKTATYKSCKMHIQRLETVYKSGICQVGMSI